MSRRAALLRARWEGLAPREKALVGGAVALLAIVLVWLIAIGPALATLRTAEEQHRALDAQLQRMRGLQAQAQTLQSQPKQGHEEALRLLELSVRQRLGTSARLVIAGERATITLTGTPPDAPTVLSPSGAFCARRSQCSPISRSPSTPCGLVSMRRMSSAA